MQVALIAAQRLLVDVVVLVARTIRVIPPSLPSPGEAS
jgi:hypothetical protein